MRWALSLAVVTTLSACATLVGLDEYEFVDEPPTPLDAGIDVSSALTDAGVDAPRDAAAVCACTIPPPSGWTSVAYADDRSQPCTGDLLTLDLVTDPAPTAAACTCESCKVATPPCQTGTYSARFDTNVAPTCNQASLVTLQVNHGACFVTLGITQNHAQLVPPAPDGPATCTAGGVFAPDKTKSRPVRVCTARPGGRTCPCEMERTPNDAGDASTTDAAVDAAALTQCVQTIGNLACPDGFPKKHLLGTNVTGTCTGCGCATTNVRCTGTATYYSDNACKTPIFVNTETCTATPGAYINSVRWTGTGAASCVTTPGTPTLGLADTSTVCCP